MNLREYLYENRLSLQKFANLIGHPKSKGYFCEIVNGKKKPGKRMIWEIERATNGAVKFNENKEWI